MKKLLCLLLFAGLLAAPVPLPAAGLPAPLLQTYPKLTLKDGKVLRDVRFLDAAYDSEGVTVHCAQGMVRVAYNLFPAQLQGALAAMRPPPAGVHGDPNFVTITKPAPPPEIVSPNAPVPVPGPVDYHYAGQINIAGPGQPERLLADVQVYAIQPAVFAAYNQQRLEKYGDVIKALVGQFETVEPPARAAAYAKATVVLYGSLDPLPAVLAETRTDAKGRFKLVCGEPAVVMLARTHLPMGQNQVGFVWAVLMQSGPPADLNLDNMLIKF